MEIRKFMFDTDFEDDILEDDALEEDVVEEPPPPTFSEEELAAARAEAYAEGVAAGRAEAEAAIERRAAEALDVIGAGLATLGQAQSASAEMQMRESLALAATIARKALPELAREAALPTVETFVRDCLTRTRNEPRVVVRVNDALLDPIQARLDPVRADSGFAGEVIVLADGALAEADCQVEWADGGAERDATRVQSEIDDAVQKFLDAARPALPPAAATPDAPPDPETPNQDRLS